MGMWPTVSASRGRCSRYQPAGFTLLEMIIVLAVFAILGLVSSQITSRVVSNFSSLNERGARLTAIHRAMGVIQRDLMQVSDRPVRDVLGTPLEPFILTGNGELTFTRFGWQNPLQRPRSELQRLGYRYADDTLYRDYWLALDQAPDSEPLSQTLLEDVAAVEFLAIDGAGNELTFWPQAAATVPPGSPAPPTSVLVAVIMRIELAPFGEIERVWALPL